MATLSNIITPSNVLTATNTQTLTNKTINGASNTITNVPLTSASGTLPVANGGTGATSLTANNVLLGNGTGAIQAVAPGTSGNLLTSNGTAWTSAAPAPGAGILQAVATGSLSNGSAVIVNANGTVSVVAAPTINPPAVYGLFTFESANTNTISATYDSFNNKVVIAYQDVGNSNYGTAVVGTIIGRTISFGTPVVFSSTNPTAAISIAYSTASNKVVINHISNTTGTAMVGTVSGTTISFGTPATYLTNANISTAIAYNSVGDKFVLACRDGVTPNGRALVGTVSGTNISFGTMITFDSPGVQSIGMTYDSVNNKVVMAFTNDNNGLAKVMVGTVSGTSISFGSAFQFGTQTTSPSIPVYDVASGKIVLAYRDGSGSGFAMVGTVSGTSISFGTPVSILASAYNSASLTYDSNLQKVIVFYARSSPASNLAVVGTVSGTSISFGTPVTVSTQQNTASAVYNPITNSTALLFQNVGGFGVSSLLQTFLTTLTTENYIGISNGAYTNGQTATIQVIGSVDDAQTGLTAAKKYYVQYNGSLALTPDFPEVFAGTAVSATKLIVKG